MHNWLLGALPSEGLLYSVTSGGNAWNCHSHILPDHSHICFAFQPSLGLLVSSYIRPPGQTLLHLLLEFLQLTSNWLYISSSLFCSIKVNSGILIVLCFPPPLQSYPCAPFYCLSPFIWGTCLWGPTWPGPWLSQAHLLSCCFCIFLAQTCSPVSALWQMIWSSCKKERIKSPHDFRGFSPWLTGSVSCRTQHVTVRVWWSKLS